MFKKLLEMLFPTPQPFKPTWYAMPFERYQEYDKRHLNECGSVIVKNVYGINPDRTMVIYFDNHVEVVNGSAKAEANCNGLKPIQDADTIENLNRRYSLYLQKEIEDYENIILVKGR